MNFLRVGNHVINMDLVSDVELDVEVRHFDGWAGRHFTDPIYTPLSGVCVHIAGKALTFTGDEAEQVRAFVSATADTHPTPVATYSAKHEAVRACGLSGTLGYYDNYPGMDTGPGKGLVS